MCGGCERRWNAAWRDVANPRNIRDLPSSHPRARRPSCSERAYRREATRMAPTHVRTRSVRAALVVMATIALVAVPSAGQSPAGSLPPPTPIPTPLDPDAVVLVGTITGSNSGPGRQVATNYAAHTTMDVVLNL